MFTVTKQWLDQQKTKSGGYTRYQLQRLGVMGWPPKKGWKQSTIGLSIPLDAKKAVEEERGKSNARPLDRCLLLIKKLNNTELELLSDACKATLDHRNKAL